MNATTLADEFEDLCLVDLFNPNLHVYPDKPEIIKSSKNVNAVLYQGFYYNHFRNNKNSVQYKCREKVNGKECNGSFTLNNQCNGTYFESTWMGPNAIFPREIWNLHDNIYHRTNNISETYDKKLNKEISKPDPNIYKLVDILKEQELLTAVSYEKANIGHKKSRRTKEDLKDKEIEILKLKYDTKQIELMEYLLALSEYVQDFN